MGTAVMERRGTTAVAAAPVELDPAVAEIITRARLAPAPAVGALSCSLAAALLLWASFYPLNWGPLAWIAAVPLLLLARLERPTRWMYRGVYLGGAAFWIASVQWMRLGDATMVPAWFALSLYMAVYFPLWLFATRLAVRRLRIPLVLAAPTAWVAFEFLRTHLMTGFGWYLLGHSQHEWTTLIQISDVTGAYGVSFIVMFAAAALAQCLPGSLLARLRLVSASTTDLNSLEASLRRRLAWVIASVLLVAAACGYGTMRLHHDEFPAGPKVALIQGDFRSEVKHDPRQAERIYLTHLALTGLTIPQRPDVVIWPETMFPFPLLVSDDSFTPQDSDPTGEHSIWNDPRWDVRPVLRDRAEQCGAAMIVGLDTQVASREERSRYNSAVFVEPGAGITGRYDKLHRVPFGEYIPLRETLPFLSRLTPFGDSFGISAGKSIQVFRLKEWRLLPLICFEDSVPQLVREMAHSAAENQQAPIDCLVNLTNDGWFRDSCEPDQHLVTAAFRCIEIRAPMVRAVNTGISAIIDGDGVVREPEKVIDYDRSFAGTPDLSGPPRASMRDPATGRYHKSFNGALVGHVPLDPRDSLYLRYGEWFPAGCLTLTCAAFLFALVVRPRPASTTSRS